MSAHSFKCAMPTMCDILVGITRSNNPTRRQMFSVECYLVCSWIHFCLPFHMVEEVISMEGPRYVCPCLSPRSRRINIFRGYRQAYCLSIGWLTEQPNLFSISVFPGARYADRPCSEQRSSPLYELFRLWQPVLSCWITSTVQYSTVSIFLHQCKHWICISSSTGTTVVN